MPTLYIHLGHPKTGSTALQNFLSTDESRLADNGVHYPSNQILKEWAINGHITSGNGQNIINYLANLSTTPKQSLVFSSEMLIFHLVKLNFLEEILRQANRLSLNILFILYTRDFFQFSFSGWGQYIKRSAGTLNYVEFMLKDQVEFSLNGNMFSLVVDFLEICTAKNLNVKVFNYENYKNNIEQHFVNAGLGLDISTDEKNTMRQNRSLTQSEYEIQRLFNKYYRGNSCDFISDVLVNKLPDTISDIPLFTADEYFAISEKYGRIVDRLNNLLDDEEKIRIVDYNEIKRKMPSNEEGVYTFNQRQLDVLAQSISSRVNERDVKLQEYLTTILRSNFWRFIDPIRKILRNR